jgi:hypothetical protein
LYFIEVGATSSTRKSVPRIGEIAEVLLNHTPNALDEIYDRYDRLGDCQ